MSPHRKNHRSQHVTTDSSHELCSSNENFDDVEMIDRAEENSQKENQQDLGTGEQLSIDENEHEVRLRSPVWQYAKKISKDKAQCNKCNKFIKTGNGGTTALKKHLIDIHGLVSLTSSSSRTKFEKQSIPRERKIRLDNLANMAIIEDGRSFGDLRKNGIRKFLAEAIPGMILTFFTFFSERIDHQEKISYEKT